MTFTPKDWRDDPDATTPLSAAALENLETRLSDYTDTTVTAHTGDTSAAHAASAVSVSPAVGGDTDVQAVLTTHETRLDSAQSGHVIEDEGTPLTARTKLNLIGSGVTVTDNAGADSTDVTINTGSAPDADGSTNGLVRLAGDLSGTAASPQIAAGAVGTTELAANAVTAAKVAADVATQAELDAVAAAAQPLDSDLTAIAALTTTSFGRSLLALADAAAAATALAPTFTTKTADYTFAIGDAWNKVYLSGATGRSFTVPANATVAFAVGTEIELGELGAGALTVVAAGGVTVDVHADFTLVLNGAGSVASLLKTATNTWLLTGQLVPA